MIRSPRRVAPIALLTISAAIGSACVSTSAPSRSGLMASADNVTVDARQLTMRIDEFTGLWLGAVEWRADSIRAASEDPTVRLNALIWKINASTAMLRATSHSDPLIAFMDAWTLVFQFKDYFEDGAGAEMFGEHTDLARELSDLAMQEYERVATRIASTQGVGAGRQIAADFAVREPIANPYFLRRSVADDLVEGLPQETRSAFASLGSITQTVESLSSRLSIYMAHLPKQARWQAQLTLEDPRYAGMLDRADESISVVRETLVDIGKLVADSPALDERFTLAVAGVVASLDDAVIELDQIVDGQRAQIEDLINDKQDEVTAFIQAERTAVLAETGRLVADVLASVETLRADTLADTNLLATETVELAYRRALRLLMILLAGMFVIVLVFRFVPQRVRAD